MDLFVSHAVPHITRGCAIAVSQPVSSEPTSPRLWIASRLMFEHWYMFFTDTLRHHIISCIHLPISVKFATSFRCSYMRDAGVGVQETRHTSTLEDLIPVSCGNTYIAPSSMPISNIHLPCCRMRTKESCLPITLRSISGWIMLLGFLQDASTAVIKQSHIDCNELLNPRVCNVEKNQSYGG